MTYESELILSNDQSFPLTLDTATYSDTVLLANAGVGDGTPIPLEIKVGTVAGAGGTSLAVALETATDAAFTSPVTYPLVPATVTASLTIGKVLYEGYLPNNLLAYMRLKYTPVGTYTAGKLFAAIPVARQLP